MRKIDRLTERIRGVAQSVWRDKTIPCGKTEWCPEGDCEKLKCDFAHIIDRLAAYEDTGLSPDEVKKLQEKVKRATAREKEATA